MSDFDREAEREKLREQFGRDEKDRESTARMSDLLLKGATMTNKHCGNCGDPIFRHDGQEFCPTCQHDQAEQQVEQAEQRARETTEQAEGDRESGRGSADEGGRPPAGADGHDGAERTDVASGSSAEATDETRAAATEAPSGPGSDAEPPAPGAGANGTTGTAGHDEPRTAATTPGDPSTAPDPTVESTAPGGGAAAGDLGAARASLVRTVTDLARRAEAADDLGRKRDLLAATEEAAAALEAVRNAE